MDLSLVVACYREEGHLEKNFQNIISDLAPTGLRFEIIFVEDKSPDRTREIIQKIVSEHPQISTRIILHEQNTGRGGAVKDGMEAARGTVVGYIDADLEIDSHYIREAATRLLRNEADVVIARRFYRRYPVQRYLASRVYNLLVRTLLNIPYRDTEAGFKFFRRDALAPILSQIKNHGWFFDTEIVSEAHRAGLRITELPVVYIKQEGKTSTVRLFRDSVTYIRDLLAYRRRTKS